ncbi:MAG: hypothetical protein K8M05_10325 [Deltaproteobacteria bacterium]|nr:hypothetical protein [Kofleriaceae bacterium]
MTYSSPISRPLLLAGIFTALVGSVPGAIAQPADSFLEQRVVEALAADGVVLSRLELTLDVEQIGGKALVSLVEPATGRSVASTKVDALPADGDAAVASLALVTRGLVDQVVATRPAVDAPAPPAQPPVHAHDDADERAAREMAELRFRREAVRFGDDMIVSGHNGNVNVTRAWVAVRGESDHRLAPREFYELMGRPELAAQYQARRNQGFGLAVVGSAMIVGSMGYGIYSAASDEDCEIGDPDFGGCLDRNGERMQRGVTVAIVGGAAGILVTGVGVYRMRRAHPVSENEAKQMADRYNEELRRDLGLPTLGSTLRPRIRDVRWAPSFDVGSGGGGLALSGRF